MNVYVASSWRNDHQQEVVKMLRAAGHDVYDYRHPMPGNEGFHWSEIDPEWKSWTSEQFVAGLAHDVARRGYGLDYAALKKADAVVLVLPSGRSAHLEAGYAFGSGKFLAVYIPPGETIEPELMYLMAHRICVDLAGVVEVLRHHEREVRWRRPDVCAEAGH